MKYFWLALIFSLWAQGAKADYFGYAAIGTALQFPGSIKAGINDWEAGLLNVDVLGADKIFRMEHGFYAAFGPIVTLSNSPGLGFFGSFGVEYSLFWGITFRAEASGAGAGNGFAKGELTAGLGLHL